MQRKYRFFWKDFGGGIKGMVNARKVGHALGKALEKQGFCVAGIEVCGAVPGRYELSVGTYDLIGKKEE